MNPFDLIFVFDNIELIILLKLLRDVRPFSEINPFLLVSTCLNFKIVFSLKDHQYEPFLKRSSHQRGSNGGKSGRKSSSQRHIKSSSSSSRRRRAYENDDALVADILNDQDSEDDDDDDENEYDYIKNDEPSGGFDVGGVERDVEASGGRAGSPSSLLPNASRRKSSSGRHNYHHSNHYRLQSTSSNPSGIGQQTRRGIVLVSRDEIIPESQMTRSKRAGVSRGGDDLYDDDDIPIGIAEALDSMPSSSSNRLAQQRNSIEMRSRSAENRGSYDRSYALITRRQLFRHRLASRFRHMNLRSNGAELTGAASNNSGEFRNQEFR